MGSRSALAPVRDGCQWAAVGVTTDSTEVYNGQCYIRGVFISETLSHDVDIKDGGDFFVRLPANLTGGTMIDFFDSEFNDSIVVDPDNAATVGSITVFYDVYPNS